MLGLSAAHAAASPNKAAELFDRAMQHVARDNYNLAIRDFTRAYLESPNHVVLYNLAQVYAVLGRSVEAIQTYERYLEEGGSKIDPDRRERVRQLIEDQKARIARLSLQLEPTDAKALVNGKPVDVSGNTVVLLEPGPVELVVRAPGYQTVTRTVTLEAGEEHRVTVHLEPNPRPAAELALAVRCAVPEVEVLVDDKLLTRLTTPEVEILSVPGHSRQLTFRKQGYAERSLPIASLAATSPTDCDLRRPTPVPPRALLPVRPTEPSGDLQGQWALALAGASLGMVLSAGIIWNFNNQRAAEWKERVDGRLCESASSGRTVPCDDPNGSLSEDDRDVLSLRDSIQRWDNVSRGLALGGALGLGGAAVLFLSRPRGKARPGESALLLFPTGVSYQQSF